jgi:hypothetical protein
MIYAAHHNLILLFGQIAYISIGVL